MEYQWKKGIIEFCILSALKEADAYGYKIIQNLEPYIVISETTLYPLLHRMEAQNYVTSYTAEFNNRTRRYYHLTDSGHQYLSQFIQEKDKIIKVLEYIGRDL